MGAFIKTRLGQFMVGSGWLAFIGMVAYMVLSHQLTIAGMEQLLKDAAPVLTGIAAGGGVHFIYNKTSKNGASNNGSSTVH